MEHLDPKIQLLLSKTETKEYFSGKVTLIIITLDELFGSKSFYEQ